MEGRVHVFISPSNEVPSYNLRHWSPFSSPPTTNTATVEVFQPSSTRCSTSQVKVILRPTVSQPLCPGVRQPSGTGHQFFFFHSLQSYLDTCGFLIMGRPLWGGNGSVIYSCSRNWPVWLRIFQVSDSPKLYKWTIWPVWLKMFQVWGSPKLYKWTNWPVWLKMFQVWGSPKLYKWTNWMWLKIFQVWGSPNHYKWTNWPVWFKIFQIWALLGGLISASRGLSQSEIHRRSVIVYGPNVWSREEMSVWCDKFRDGRTALNDDPEKQGQTKDHAHWK
jgi:hypothetical protein